MSTQPPCLSSTAARLFSPLSDAWLCNDDEQSYRGHDAERRERDAWPHAPPLAPSSELFDTSWLADIMSHMKIPPAPLSTDGDAGHDGLPRVAAQLASPFHSPRTSTTTTTHAHQDERDTPSWAAASAHAAPRRTDTPVPRPRWPLPTGSAPPTLYSVFVGGLEEHVTDEDLVWHFAHPPCWPQDHPMRRMYVRIENVAGSLCAWPTSPAPFRVHSARVVRESSSAAQGGRRVFGFVRLTSKHECDRALIEMQHTHMVPHQAPHTPLRLSLGAATAPPRADTECTKAHGRPHDKAPARPVMTAAAVVRHTPRRAASKAVRPARTDVPAAPGRSHTPPASTHAPVECVPTTLTFVSESQGDVPAQDQPHLASALTVAHASSALDPTNTTVFVGSLFTLATETMLHALFSPFGPIHSINIPRGQDCGFVQFAHKRDAARAIAEMQGYQLSGGGALRLSWGRSLGEKAAARAAIRAGLRWVEGAATAAATDGGGGA